MAIEAELPDGRVLEFPDGTSPDVIQRTVKRVLGVTAEGAQSTLLGEAALGAKQLFSALRTTGASVADANRAALEGAQRSEEYRAEAGEGPSLEALGRKYQEAGVLPAVGKALASDVPRALAGQSTNIAAMTAAAAAGAKLGAAAPIPGGTLLGTLAGPAVVAFPQAYAENLQAQARAQQERGEPVDVNRATAAAAAAAQSVVEAGGFFLTLGKRAITNLFGKTAEVALSSTGAAGAAARAKLLEEAKKTLARGAARGAVVEPATEVAQSIITRAQAGQDLLSPEALADYGEQAYGGLLVGAPMGGAGNYISRRAAQRELAATTPPTAAPAAEEPTPEVPPTAAVTPPAATAPSVEDTLSLNRFVTPTEAEVAEGEEGVPEPRVRGRAVPEAAPEAAPTAVAPEAAVAPETEAVPTAAAPEVAPAPEGVLTRESLIEAGFPANPKPGAERGVAGWLEENVYGKTLEDVQEMVRRNPALVKGNSLRAETLRDLLTPPTQPYVEPENAQPPYPAVEFDEPDVRGSERGVEVPSGGEPVAGVPATEPAGPDTGRLGRAVAPAGPRDDVEGAQLAALSPAPAPAPAAAPIDRVRPLLRPEVKPNPKLAAVAQAYTTRLDADRADVARLPEYLGWDLYEGSTFAPNGMITKIGFSKENLNYEGTGGAYSQRLYEALTPDAKAQARAAAKQYWAQERRAEQALKRLNEQQQRARAEQTDLDAAARDEFVEGTTEDERARLAAKFRAEGRGDEAALPADVVEALRADNVSDALLRLSEQATDPLVKRLAERLSPLLVNTRVTISPDLRNPEGEAAAGAASTDGMRIWLDENRGLNVETFLHESVHAGSERIIAAKPSARTAQQQAAVEQLNALWEDAKARPALALSADARGSLSEFVAEAMTNPALVDRLRAVPWKLGSFWTGFKRTLLRMLGLGDPQTMQEAVTASVDTIFSRPMRGLEGVRFQLPRDVKSMLEEATSPARKETLLGTVRAAYPHGRGMPGEVNAEAVSMEERIRTRAADKAATVITKLNAAVAKGQIDAMATKQVVAGHKQAEAADQLLPSFLRNGRLVRDPATGGWLATAPDGTVAPVEVFSIVDAWGKKNGFKDFDAAWDAAAERMESARQFEFRRMNEENRATGGRMFPVSMKSERIDALYPQYKADADLQRAKAILDTTRHHLIDRMVEVGRISKATAEQWKAVVDYVPFDRLEQFAERSEKIVPSIVKGLSVAKRLPKLVDAQWTSRQVENVLNNQFKQLGWMVQEVVRTDALNRTLAALATIDQAKFLGFKQPPKGDLPFVRGFSNGREVFFSVPSIYHAAAFNITVTPLPAVFRMFGQISNFLRSSITMLPTFTASQLPQDIQRAIITSGVKDPIALTARILSNFKTLGASALKGKLAEATPELSAIGIVGDVDFRVADPAASLLKEFGYRSHTALKSKAIGTLLHRLNEIARASDVAVRKGIYDQTLAETQDKLLAATRAREIINFRSYGMGDPLGVLPIMLQTVPFTNAYLQGTDIWYRALTGKNAISGLARRQALKQFWTYGAVVMAASSLYALAMSDDETYKKMNLDERDRSWVLGDGVSIPVPAEIGILFKALPERAVEAWLKYGTPEQASGMAAITSWFRAARDTYAGGGIPTAMVPALEVMTNYSFRLGRPIVGTYLEGVDPSQQQTERTSELAKGIAKYSKETLRVEVSPIMIDHLLNGYFGTTAALGLMVMDAAVNPNRVDRPFYQMIGLTPFTYNPVGRRDVTEFYDVREKVVRAHRTLNDLAARDLSAASRYVEENREKLILYKAVNGTLEELSETRKYKRWLNSAEAAKKYTSAERLKMRQEVEKHEGKIVEWVQAARTQMKL